MKKNYKFIFMLISVLFLIIFLIYISNTSYQKIKMGISLQKAENFIREKSDYVIISIDDISGGTVYKCETGKYKGKYVKLIGEKGTQPDIDCSNVLTWPRQNKFLIKIKSMEENVIDNGIYKTELDIVCENYEFIIPIKREYCYSKHERFFYPQDYIDEYDLIHGDYKK